MRKILTIVCLSVICGQFITGCEQEDVVPQHQIDDLELTERDGSEPEDGGVRPKSK